jgi:hypothetical protein
MKFDEHRRRTIVAVAQAFTLDFVIADLTRLVARATLHL